MACQRKYALCYAMSRREIFHLIMHQWMCAHCWSFHARDLNAAINMLRQGIAELYKVTPAELAGEGHGEDVSLEVGLVH
jgi:transposase